MVFTAQQIAGFTGGTVEGNPEAAISTFAKIEEGTEGALSFLANGENIMVRVHPNFRMVGLGNTSGEGENELYSSRSKIDESVLERLTSIFFDYDLALEDSLFGIYENWKGFARNFRKATIEWAKKESLTGAQGGITTRDISAIARYAKNNSKALEEVLAQKFIQTKDEQYLGYLIQKITTYYDLGDVRKFKYPTNIGKDLKEKDIAKAFVLESKKKMSA